MVFDRNNKFVGNFDGNEDLISFISSKNHHWWCSRVSFDELQKRLNMKKPEYVTTAEYKAVNSGFGLIEIKRGVSRPLKQIVLLPDIDTESLLYDFYKSACAEWGWHIRKTVFATKGVSSRLSKESGSKNTLLTNDSPLFPSPTPFLNRNLRHAQPNAQLLTRRGRLGLPSVVLERRINNKSKGTAVTNGSVSAQGEGV